MDTHTPTLTHKQTHTHTHIHTYIHTHTIKQTKNIHKHTHIHIHTHTHTHTYIHIHTHTYTHKGEGPLLWGVYREKCLSRSLYITEIKAMYEGVKKIQFVCHLMRQLGLPEVKSPTPILNGNQRR